MMKPKLLTKSVKLLFVLALFTVGAVSAQQTTGDVTQGTGVDYGTDDISTAADYSVRVIDNKGTIKYFQVKNGLTMLTNTTSNITTTTWQLGGTLSDDTYIDVDGNVFGLDGLELETGTASTDATDQSDHGTGTGWTLLVRDEATGATRKLLAKNLLQSGSETMTEDADVLTGTFTITATGMPATASKVWVYRNGAKLIAGTDYTTTADTVTLTVNPGTGVANWVSFTGDVYEVQWVK